VTREHGWRLGRNYAQLERLRKQADDHSKFYDIDRDVLIQILIFMVPA
jgi:hypothetical protein